MIASGREITKAKYRVKRENQKGREARGAKAPTPGRKKTSL